MERRKGALAKKILRTQFALHSRLGVKARGYRKELCNIVAITIDGILDNKTANVAKISCNTLISRVQCFK